MPLMPGRLMSITITSGCAARTSSMPNSIYCSEPSHVDAARDKISAKIPPYNCLLAGSDWSLITHWRASMVKRHPHQFRQGIRLHLAHDACAVGFDRWPAGTAQIADHPVGLCWHPCFQDVA